MSTVVTSNISDGTDTVGTEYVVNGSAKCFWRTSGGYTGLPSSLNVSSLVDNGVGNYDITTTNAFVSSSDMTNISGVSSSAARIHGSIVSSASVIACRVFDSGGTAANTNSTGAIFGELA